MHRVILVAGLVAFGAAAVPGSAERPYCSEPHGTLAENRYLRVYESDLHGYRVCDRRTGVQVRIGERWYSSSGYVYIEPAAVAGTVAAWQRQEGPTGDAYPCYTSNSIHARDFGRRRSRVSIALRSNGLAKELVVKRNRSLAWIESRPPSSGRCGDEDVYLVRRRDSRGAQVLSRGTSRPRDLTLRRSRLTWTDDSGTHSASLR